MEDDFGIPERLAKEFSHDQLMQMKEQFDVFDDSGDGSIDAEEMQNIMKKLGIEVDQSELEKLIKKVDINNSNALEFDEFVKLMSNLRKGKGGLLSSFIQNSKQAFLIRNEFQELIKDPVEYCQVFSVEGNPREWSVELTGLPETPYEGGVFTFQIIFGVDYPYMPPSMKLLTRIYHLNFAMLLNGTSGLESILCKWQADWKIRSVLGRLVQLFTQPNEDLALTTARNSSNCIPTIQNSAMSCRQFNEQVIKMHQENSNKYNALAKEFTKRFAKSFR